MDEQHIIYEQPLGELVRVSLRLELLFKRLNQALSGHDTRYYRDDLTTLCQLLTLIERPDLKSKWAKEFNRIQENFSRLQTLPGVDTQALSQCVQKVASVSDYLQQQTGKFAQSLQDNPFLSSAKQHLVMPGGGSSFDFPAFHHWLHTQRAQPDDHLQAWISALNPVKDIVALHLALIRESGSFKSAVAESGFFQLPLEANLPCQLVRVRLLETQPTFPEISVGKHRASIRFLTSDKCNRPTQAQTDIPFELMVCYL